MRLTVAEVLKIINDGPDYQSRVNALLNFNAPILEQLLQYNFAEHIQFNLPPGAPPFKRDEDAPLGMSYTKLEMEAKRLYIFLKGYGDNVPQLKKEQNFIDMLEGLHPTEADVLLAVKDKTLQQMYPNITYEFVYETIHDLLPHPSTRTKVDAPIVQPTPTVAVPEATVEKVSGDVSEENLEVIGKHQQAMQRWGTDENGKRVRLKSDGTPWPTRGQLKKAN